MFDGRVVPINKARRYRAIELPSDEDFEDPEVDVDAGALGCGARVLATLLSRCGPPAASDSELLMLWCRVSERRAMGLVVDPILVTSQADRQTNGRRCELARLNHDGAASELATLVSRPSAGGGDSSSTTGQQIVVTDIQRRSFCAVIALFSGRLHMVCSGRIAVPSPAATRLRPLQGEQAEGFTGSRAQRMLAQGASSPTS